MDTQDVANTIGEQAMKGSFQTASNAQETLSEATNLIKIFAERGKFLDILKTELRGETLYQDQNGERFFVQVERPTFVMLDQYNKPMKWMNPQTKKEEFIPNEEAITSIIQTLKSCGLNSITPFTALPEEEIRADLFEMESKLAVLLANKRKKWGIDKAEYPVILGNLKVMIKDARYMAKEGIVLKAIRTITSRIEQATEGQKAQTWKDKVTSPLR